MSKTLPSECAYCGKPIRQKKRGRIKLYCGSRCRVYMCRLNKIERTNEQYASNTASELASYRMSPSKQESPHG